ncbi:hypothetical protein [uncultured Methanobrevibacter sp.]|nr:hypothetical protein [uncultured Methanobrevibacter sp.]
MNFKKILIILFIIFIVSITTVSAVDINDMNMNESSCGDDSLKSIFENV